MKRIRRIGLRMKKQNPPLNGAYWIVSATPRGLNGQMIARAVSLPHRIASTPVRSLKSRKRVKMKDSRTIKKPQILLAETLRLQLALAHPFEKYHHRSGLEYKAALPVQILRKVNRSGEIKRPHYRPVQAEEHLMTRTTLWRKKKKKNHHPP